MKENELSKQVLQLAIEKSDNQIVALQKALEDAGRELTARGDVHKTLLSNSLGNSLAHIQGELVQKSAELDALRSAISEDLREKDSLKLETIRLSAELQEEISKNQERKKKMREFANNISEEKKTIELRCQRLERSEAEAISKKQLAELALDQSSMQRKSELESKDKEIAFLKAEILDLQVKFADDLSIKNSEFEEFGKLKIAEIEKLTILLAEAKMSTSAEALEAHRQFQEVQKEAEAHKSKRITARNEMIALAQALEKAQADEVEMRVFFVKSLVPAVYTVVSALEQALHSLRKISGQISSKKTFMCKSSLHNRFIKKRADGADSGAADSSHGNSQYGRSSGSHLNTSSHNSTHNSTHSSSGSSVNGVDLNTFKSELTSPASVASNFSDDIISKRSQNSTVAGSLVVNKVGVATASNGRGGTSVAGGINCTSDLTNSVRSELEILQTGALLLNQSLEHLHETVMLDSHFCLGGFSDLVSVFSGRGTTGYDYIGTSRHDDSRSLHQSAHSNIIVHSNEVGINVLHRA